MMGENTRYGVRIRVTDLSDVDRKQIERELTVSPIVLQQLFPKKFRVFRKTETHVVVPRFWAPEIDGLRVRNEFKEHSKIRVEFTGIPKKELHQDVATDAVMRS